VRGDDRLLYASQTAWERARNILRGVEAHNQSHTTEQEPDATKG